MKLSLIEQETIFNFNEGEKTAGIYTFNRSLLKKLEALAKKYPDEVKLERTSWGGQAADYIIPKSWIKINPPRVMSEAEKELRRKILQEVNKRKSNLT